MQNNEIKFIKVFRKNDRDDALILFIIFCLEILLHYKKYHKLTMHAQAQ